MLDKNERKSLALQLAELSGKCIAAAVEFAMEEDYSSLGLLYIKAVRDKAQAILDKATADMAD
jgi:hypothetical protein